MSELTPREHIQMLYALYPQPRSFAVDEYLHQRSGYVIDMPTAFLMGRPVDKDDCEEHIRDPAIRYNLANAWFIWAFAGDIAAMMHLAPYELPYVGWIRRNGRIRWYACNEALRTMWRLRRCQVTIPS